MEQDATRDLPVKSTTTCPRLQIPHGFQSSKAKVSGSSLRHIAPVSIRVQDLHVAIKPDQPLGGLGAFGDNVIKALKTRIGQHHDVSGESTLKHVLSGVSADMPSGSLTAIIGASGSGKTTLLNTIAHRVSGKNLDMSGKVTFNGDESYQSICSSYVMQQDILLPSLTVRETLEYAAELRLADTTKEERMADVESVILELGLKDCSNTRIGSHFRKGCSGGEKRKTSIGVQMLANPSVLCCDEPTTGLDAYSALQVVRTLKKLAERGRTVIMSIHSPRSEIWTLLDRVVLLSKGYVLYAGLSNEAVLHFQECGIVKPLLENPAEFLIDVASVDDRSHDREKLSYDRIHSLRQTWDNKVRSSTNWRLGPPPTPHEPAGVYEEKNKAFERVTQLEVHVKEKDEFMKVSAPPSLSHTKSSSSLQSIKSPSDADASEYSVPWGTISIIRPGEAPNLDVESVYRSRLGKVRFTRQLMALTRRSVKVTLREPLGVIGSLLEVIFISLVGGWIFYSVGDDLAGIHSRLGALFNAAVFQGYVVFTVEIYRLIEDIKVFDRERSEGVSSVFGFLISRHLSKLFLENLPVPIIFSIIYFLLVGFRHVASVFFIFLAIQVIIQYTAITLAVVCVAVSRHLAGATLVGNIAFIVQTFCCGYFIQVDQIAVSIRWLKWASFTFYTFGALVTNEFLGVDAGPLGQVFDCSYSKDVADPRCVQYTGKYVVETLGLPNNWLWRPLVIMCAFPIAFFFGAALILTFWRVDIVVSGTQKNPPKENIEDMDLATRTRENIRPIEVGLHQYGVVLQERSLLRGKSQKVIVHPITTTFEPGCINVVMGPSGSGKTTLLQSIAHRFENDFFHKYHSSGEITLNRNIPPSPSVLKCITSFVTQDDDTLMPSLTVRETLRFAAGLRLPSSMSKADKRRRVEEVILKMGLKNCADRLVGDDLRKGISGGEKRRVSIATQILTNPKILLLDEPTSGLDTFTATSVMEVLQALADEGRTILLTIHQPRADLFKSFKNILVLARGGHVVYSGPGSDVLPYIARSFDLHCPLDASPADFVLDTIAIDLQEQGLEDVSRKRVERFIARWRDDKPRPVLERMTSGVAAEAELDGYRRRMNPFWITFPVVLQRSALNMWRNAGLVLARNGQVVGLAFIFTLFFAPLRDDQEAIQSRIGFVQQTTSLYFVGMLQNLSIYPSSLSLFRRDHTDTCYTSFTFLLSHTMLEVPLSALSSLFFGLMAAYASNLGRTDPTVCFVTALDIFCIVSCGESLGIIFCTLLEEGNEGFALTVTSTLIAVSTSMAGLLSLRLPGFLAAVNWVSPSRYLVASLARYAFVGRVFGCSAAQQVEGRCPLSTGEEVLELYGFDGEGWVWLVGMVGIMVAYRVLAYVVLVLKMRGR